MNGPVLVRLLLVASIGSLPSWPAHADGAVTSADVKQIAKARIDWTKVVAALPPQNVFSLAFRARLRLAQSLFKEVAALSAAEQKQLDLYHADVRAALKRRQQALQMAQAKALTVAPLMVDQSLSTVRQKYGKQRKEFVRALLDAQVIDASARHALSNLLRQSTMIWGPAS